MMTQATAEQVENMTPAWRRISFGNVIFLSVVLLFAGCTPGCAVNLNVLRW